MMDGVMNLCRVKFRDHQRLARDALGEYSVPTRQGMTETPRAGNDGYDVLMRHDIRAAAGGFAGVDYLLADVGPDGRMRDWYSYAQGDRTSATMRRLMGLMLEGDGGNVIATAISVAGPAKIPAPGPAAGQMAYVFTAVGTPAPAAQQKLPLNVTWVNLTTGMSGSATLKPNPEINPQGPTTLTAIVDTGSGSIMSTIFGQVTTLDKQCTFLPTIGSSVVP